MTAAHLGALDLIWMIALALAGGALLWMGGLILMRVVDERRAGGRARDRAAVEAALIGLLQRRETARAELAPYCRRTRLMAETLLDFLSLVRGDDRAVVLQALTELGLPSALRRRIHQGSPAGRLACLEALAAFPAPATERALLAASSEGSARMRIAALRALEDIGAFVPLRRLISELASGELKPTAVVGEFVHKVVQRDPEAAWGELSAREAASPAVRLLLIDALGASGDYRAAAALIGQAGDPDPEVREAAVKALGRLMHPAAAPCVRAALTDPDWRVRAAAASAAGAIRLSDLDEGLVAQLSDPVWRVRFQAAQSLAQLGAPGLERLEHAARAEQTDAGAAAAMALAELRSAA